MSLTPVLLGLGSNIARESHLLAGLEALSEVLSGMRCSPVFESLAVGIRSDNFYNLVVHGFTALPLLELDRRLKFIEADNGRYAPDRKGLPLDIDVLTYADLAGQFDGLLLPRPEILKNAFVLWPLALLAPDTRHPGAGRTFAELWAAASIDQQLWPVPFQWRGLELTPNALTEAYPRPDCRA
ncbi:2-amino-4-hydroxy-6-hydroxymethyldihydropteridine diphosphokinase [Stutzerimonas nosocomialis]|uniref:2-amino-4-hydroxy-6- hydroxymethyldihydropteridine diphosphokinase n=1 Tax=Stutzerimonas nosocomialis TaxID=1056496 RepID=UPI001109EA87|nr:2-amino-4-hydroxy-6-hydroxymethyldihydropteridine diphosphokinase [Stutzerimonas nosocomialis]TLX59726.1 2-amino-4-hydroxy-6-hydroxymethyldihydropteridine diphosphokinase [Stutzerimonas nosocomialis]